MTTTVPAAPATSPAELVLADDRRSYVAARLRLDRRTGDALPVRCDDSTLTAEQALVALDDIVADEAARAADFAGRGLYDVAAAYRQRHDRAVASRQIFLDEHPALAAMRGASRPGADTHGTALR
jgi:hypothetical protein